MSLECSKNVSLGARLGRLFQVSAYLDAAILAMWTRHERAIAMMDMAEASVRGRGCNRSEEDLLKTLRALAWEAKEHQAHGDQSAALCRMRVAHDLVTLHVIGTVEEKRFSGSARQNVLGE